MKHLAVIWALALAAGGCGQTLAKLADGSGPLAAEAKAVVQAFAKSGMKPKDIGVWEGLRQMSKCDTGKPCAGVIKRGDGSSASIVAIYARGVGDIDLAPLKGLKSLQRLHLARNRITKVSGLAGNPKLAFVDLSQNNITSVDGLESLPMLRRLDLRKNQISKISGLKNLPALNQLGISGNPLISVTNLSNLGITSLDFGNASGLGTLANLTQLPRLRRIVAVKGTLQSLELSNLPALEVVDVCENQLAKLSLRNLPKLKMVHAVKNKLTDAGLTLANLRSLENLGLSQNQLTKVPALSGSTKLKQLYLQRNKLASLEGLEALKTMPREIFVDRNQITTLEAFKGKRYVSTVRLATLSADYNKLTDLKGIEKMRFIRNLYLNRNQITSLDGIDKLRFLRKLHVGYNKLTTLSPLKVKGLKELVARGNKIKSAPELFGPEGNRKPTIGYYDLRGNAFPATYAVVMFYGRPPLYRGLYRRPVVWTGRRRVRYGGRYGSRSSRYGYRRVGSRYSRGGSYRSWGK